MKGAYLGPAFAQPEIERRLRAEGARFTTVDDRCLLELCTGALAEGKVLGWFQGRMEFGPRALSNRSILADARAASMQSVPNRKVKFRESFRPFASSVLREDVNHWFDLDTDGPYILLTAAVTAPSGIPAVTHVDSSARFKPCTRKPSRTSMPCSRPSRSAPAARSC